MTKKKSISDEKKRTSPPPSSLTLREAIDFGEYKPEYLEQFEEWETLSPHIQWELIRKALDIRHKQLITQYAELNNVLNLSKKPQVQLAMKDMENQLDDFMQDREALYVEYSRKMV